MTSTPTTVIIPTHNGAERIGALLRTLEGGEHQILVVDNASADLTGDVLARHPGVEVLRSESNLGFGAAINLAARRAEGQTLVLLNDDCTCDPGFVTAIAAPLSGDVVMAAGAMRDLRDPEKIDTAGMQLDPTLLPFDYLHGEPVTALRKAPDPIGPSAAAAAFARSAFLDAGGFDEALFAYWEDVDLVLRLRLAGGSCALAREATGTHMHSATLGSGSREKNALMGYGRGYVLRKWSVMRGRRALRALLLDAGICLGQAIWDHNLTGVGARIRGYRAAPPPRPYPGAVLADHPSPGPAAELDRRLRRRLHLRQRTDPSRKTDREEGEIVRQLAAPGPATNAQGVRLTADLTTPTDPVRVGAGTAVLVGGRLNGLEARPGSLRLVVDGRPIAERVHAIRSRQGSWFWWSLLTIEASERRGRLRLALAAPVSGGGTVLAEAGTVFVEPGAAPAGPERPASLDRAVEAATSHGGPLVAICMATYNPRRELLERQLGSIAAQTHGAWICIICDDGSDPERLAEIVAAAEGDPRFVVARNDRRLGFYRNYERALEAIPAEASLVALADQDDRWEPDKLSLLIEAIADRALAYGDMRIVDEQGRLISDTYWSARRNNYTDLASLLVGNTVTGAASLFRASLLDRMLPFPPQRGRSYHDHWIALTAMLDGGLAFVDRPIQDYVQHTGSAQGHAEANAGGLYLRFSSLLPIAWQGLAALAGRDRGEGWAHRYFGMHSRTLIWARVLLARFDGSLDPRRRRILRRVANAERSPVALAWLGARSLRPLWGANEAFGRELILFSSVLWCRAVALRSGPRGASGSFVPPMIENDAVEARDESTTRAGAGS